jgi:hypothetical protein
VVGIRYTVALEHILSVRERHFTLDGWLLGDRRGLLRRFRRAVGGRRIDIGVVGVWVVGVREEIAAEVVKMLPTPLDLLVAASEPGVELAAVSLLCEGWSGKRQGKRADEHEPDNRLHRPLLLMI